MRGQRRFRMANCFRRPQGDTALLDCIAHDWDVAETGNDIWRFKCRSR